MNIYRYTNSQVTNEIWRPHVEWILFLPYEPCFYRSNSKKEEISCLRSSFWFYPMTLDSCNVIFFNHDYKIVNVGSSVRSTCVIEMS